MATIKRKQGLQQIKMAIIKMEKHQITDIVNEMKERDNDKSETDSRETSISSSALLYNNNNSNNGCDIDNEIISIFLEIWRNDKCNSNTISQYTSSKNKHNRNKRMLNLFSVFFLLRFFL